jgi:succinate dehydrogenase/fumarate reductase flavoprotein subunit
VKNIEWVQGLKEGIKVHSHGGAGFLTVPGAEAMKKYILHGSGKGPTAECRRPGLDAFGEPIPGLYSAGELGSLWGVIYQGAGNIAECMVFGRISGRNVATK